MTRSTRLLLSAAALLSLWAGTGAASAQGYYGDDGPPPFRRGPGWDRPPPPRGPWDRWHHHRHWRDGGFEGRGGWRDGDRGPRGGGFGDDGRRREFRRDDGGRGPGGGPPFRRGGDDG